MIWFIIASLLVSAGVMILVTRPSFDTQDKTFYSGMFVVCGAPALAGLAFWACAWSGGLRPNYAVGEIEGSVVDIKEEGVIYKTVEGQIHVRPEQQVGGVDLRGFSVPADRVGIKEQLEASMGKRVRLKYVQWFVMPYRRGWSNTEVVGVEVLPQEEKAHVGQHE